MMQSHSCRNGSLSLGQLWGKLQGRSRPMECSNACREWCDGAGGEGGGGRELSAIGESTASGRLVAVKAGSNDAMMVLLSIMEVTAV